MFLVDNLLGGPGQAAMFVLKEIARKAQEDWLDDDAVKQELQEIYALAEAGKISSQEFEARECRLLERLEQIARAKFNDKWGQADAPVIEAEVRVEALPMMTNAAPLVIEAAPVIERTPEMETPWMIDDPPVIEARAGMPASAGETMPWSPPPPVQSPAPAPPPRFVAPPAAPSRATAPPPAPPAPSMPPAPATRLSIGQVFESTARALALLNLKVSVITSVAPEDDGWRVTAELVERRGVPDTNDLIGVYELRLDAAGIVTRYERTRLRRRGDLGR
jgi:hypothetical protein